MVKIVFLRIKMDLNETQHEQYVYHSVKPDLLMAAYTYALQPIYMILVSIIFILVAPARDRANTNIRK